jgi:hypothetical protein
MATTALTQLTSQTVPTAVLRQVGQQDDEAPSRKRQPPQGQGRPISLPEDRVTLTVAASAEQPQRSQAVSAREKAALLGSQKVPRFSVYG